MKLEFSDKSFIQCDISNAPGKFIVSISAKDQTNPLKNIINSCELTLDEMKQVFSEIIS